MQELSEAGGTNAAATKILHDYKAETNDSEIEVPDFDEMIEPSSMSEADFYESEKETKPTTHVSSDDLEEKYSVYGCFSIGKHWQQLELDGIYTIEEAKNRGRWLKENLPTIDWLLYDELNKKELEID